MLWGLEDLPDLLERAAFRFWREEIDGWEHDGSRHSIDDIRPISDIVEAYRGDLRNHKVEQPVCLWYLCQRMNYNSSVLMTRNR